MSDICNWRHFDFDNDSYQTDCGEIFEFIEGGVVDNSFAWCPYCGKEIAENEDL